MSGLLSGVAVGCSTDTSDPANLLAALFDGQSPFITLTSSHNGGDNRGAEITDLLNQTMVLARTTLYCSFKDVNIPSVIDSLRFARNSGVDVQVGIDEDFKDGIGYRQLQAFLATSGDKRKLWTGNGGDGQVHMNLCVADGTRVWVSSSAPTVPEMNKETAFAIFFQSNAETGLARKFNVEMDLITHGSFGSGKQRLNRRNHWLIGDIDVGVYVAPSEDPLSSFIVPRIKGAANGIQIFSSEFFASSIDNSTDTRRAGDVAFEVAANNRGIREIVGTWWTYYTPDPEKDNFNSIKNSMNYLIDNGVSNQYVLSGDWPDNGMSIIILNGASAHPTAMISTNPISKRTDSSHDGITFIFEHPTMVNAISDFYRQLRDRSQPASAVTSTGTDITVANQREIVISEVNWMGAYKNTGTSQTTREYIELYNNTDAVINISNWEVECGTSGGFANPVLKAPLRAVVAPKSHFLFTVKSNSFVHDADVIMTRITSGTPAAGEMRSISNSDDQCRIKDADGTVVDVIGVAGTGFDTEVEKLGYNDTANKIRRSMERINLAAAGDSIDNWHTNSNTVLTNYNVTPDYVDTTFGTPGYANSPVVPIAPVVQSATPTGSVPFYAQAVSFTFSKAMDASSFSVSSLTLNAGSVTSFVGLSNSDQTATFLVSLPSSAQTIQATLSASVRSADQVEMGTAYVHSFTTEVPSTAVLKVSELFVDDSADAIEFTVTSPGTLTGLTVYRGTTLEYTFPTTPAFSVGDVIVLHAQASGTNETGGNPTASADAGNTPGYDFWDSGIGSITSTDAEIEVRDPNAFTLDYVAYSDGGLGSGQDTRLATALANGNWTYEGSTVTADYLVDSTLDNGTGNCMIRTNTGANTTHNDSNSVADFTGGTCDLGNNQAASAPYNVTAASAAVNNTTVTLTLNFVPQRAAAETASNYSITGGVGLSVTAASLSGKTITLTTSTHVGGQAYTVTLTNIPRYNDNANFTTASQGFNGFSPPAVVKITKVFVDDGDDAMELRVTSAGTLTGFRVLEADTLIYTFPTTPTFNVGDIIVVHFQNAGTNEVNGNASEATETGNTPGFDFWDAGAGSVTSTDRELQVQDATMNAIDYVAWVDGAFGSGQSTRVETHISNGEWTKAGGSVATSDLVASSLDNGTGNCMKRRNTGAGTAHIDTNSASDWAGGTCNLGTNDNVP